jgi:hypothetical protein
MFPPSLYTVLFQREVDYMTEDYAAWQTGPPLDFAVLPLDTGVELLQRVGARLLDQLLTSARRPELMDLLTRQDRNLLRLSPGRAFDRYERNPSPTRFGLKTLFQRPAALYRRSRQGGYGYAAIMRDSLRNGASSEWRERLLSEVERLIDGVNDENIPVDWWELIAERAWGDLEFQRQSGDAARLYLRDKVLFPAGKAPCPRFAPQFFWLLILLAAYDRPLAVFREAAAAQVSQPQWAGLWDQWFVREAICQWPETVFKLPSGVRRGLLALPFLENLPAKVLAVLPVDVGTAAPLNLAQTNWREGAWG